MNTNTWSERMIRRLSVAAAVLLLSRVAAAATPVLTFDEIKKTDAQATFRPFCTPTQPPANFMKLDRAATNTQAFFIYYDPEAIDAARFGYFDYTFYVGVQGKNPPEWYTCATQVYTHGDFLDRFEPAHFTVHVGDVTDDGTIEVP